MVERDPVKECIIEELLLDLQAESPANRLRAFEQLLNHLEFDTVRLELRKHCFRETDPEVRHFAMRSYDSITPRSKVDFEVSPSRATDVPDRASPETLKDLHNQLAALDDPAQKIRLLQKSGLEYGKDFLAILAHEIKLYNEPVFLAFSMSLFGRSRDLTYAPLVTEYLSHSSQRVRANAIEALSSIQPPDLAKTLAPLLDEPDNRIRANAILALISIDRENALRSLRRMAVSSLESDRDSALYCLSQMNTEDIGVILRKMFVWETVDYLVQKQAFLLFPILRQDDGDLLVSIVGASASSPTKRALTKKMIAQLGLTLPELQLKTQTRTGRMTRSIQKKLRYLELVTKSMEGNVFGFLTAYIHRPIAVATFSVGVMVASVLFFSLMTIPEDIQPVARLANIKPGPRDRVTAPSAVKHWMSVRGVVRQVGDSWALVDTGSAFYQLTFSRGLPAGCLPETFAEAGGFYTGYDYASGSIYLECKSNNFRSISRENAIWGG